MYGGDYKIHRTQKPNIINELKQSNYSTDDSLV